MFKQGVFYINKLTCAQFQQQYVCILALTSIHPWILPFPASPILYLLKPPFFLGSSASYFSYPYTNDLTVDLFGNRHNYGVHIRNNIYDVVIAPFNLQLSCWFSRTNLYNYLYSRCLFFLKYQFNVNHQKVWISERSGLGRRKDPSSCYYWPAHTQTLRRLSESRSVGGWLGVGGRASGSIWTWRLNSSTDCSLCSQWTFYTGCF